MFDCGNSKIYRQGISSGDSVNSEYYLVSKRKYLENKRRAELIESRRYCEEPRRYSEEPRRYSERDTRNSKKYNSGADCDNKSVKDINSKKVIFDCGNAGDIPLDCGNAS